MAKTTDGSLKRVAINKANAKMVAVVAAATFLTILAIFATKAAFSQNRYLARVSTAKTLAKRQLDSDLSSYTSLKNSYQVFDTESPNVIGGSSTGAGESDGTNSQIILDALPSTYDFPALTSSLEKILTSESLKVGSITGTDDQLAQQSNTSSPMPSPQTIPFTFSVTDTGYASITDLVHKLNSSIRPLAIDSMSVSGGGNAMQMTLTGHTYYQPSKNLKIPKKAVL